jgi:hypothetical protein
MKKTAALLLPLLLLLPRCAMAWGAAGHAVIAAEAYRKLSPEFKAEVIEVLKAHPDYAKWQSAYRTNASFDVFAYVFMRSSTWPDEIRRRGNKYDHPDWHYIDYPLRPPGFAFEPAPKPQDDVLYGVARCEKTLSDTKADPELRAASLSFLIHLVGDMHQPLHCASLFTADYPNGDKGGNDFYVMPAQRSNWDYSVKTGPALTGQKAVRLHGIWDGLLGSSANPRTQWNYATEIDAKYSRASLPELATHANPKEWSLESREMAIDKAYLRGELKGSTNQTDAPSLPPDYTKQAKAVAEKQAALAGYRLADEITKYLKCADAVPLLPIAALDAAPASLPKRISAAEAKNYYDETMVVAGKVAQVSVRPNMAFINLDQPFPNSPFAAVIFQENLSLFPDLQKLNNQNVEITGTITEYRGKPEIILESTNQVKVIGGN